MNIISTTALSKPSVLLLLPILVVALAACDTLDDNEEVHPDLEMLEVIDRGDAQQPVIAVWTDDDGWNVEELEFATPLRPGGDRASIGFRAYNHDLDELPLEEDGEFFITYRLADGAPADIINMGLDEDDLYHGDHAHIYPQAEGETEIEFLLWHVDHAEGATDPITIRVQEPEME